MKDAKQEILHALDAIQDLNLACATSSELTIESSIKMANVDRIRTILETHTLEPIDDRPFDPTLCGFVRENLVTTLGTYYRSGIVEIAQVEDRIQVWTTKKICDAPWPATQSEGERMLKLLGVLK